MRLPLLFVVVVLSLGPALCTHASSSCDVGIQSVEGDPSAAFGAFDTDAVNHGELAIPSGWVVLDATTSGLTKRITSDAHWLSAARAAAVRSRWCLDVDFHKHMVTVHSAPMAPMVLPKPTTPVPPPPAKFAAVSAPVAAHEHKASAAALAKPTRTKSGSHAPPPATHHVAAPMTAHAHSASKFVRKPAPKATKTPSTVVTTQLPQPKSTPSSASTSKPVTPEGPTYALHACESLRTAITRWSQTAGYQLHWSAGGPYRPIQISMHFPAGTGFNQALRSVLKAYWLRNVRVEARFYQGHVLDIRGSGEPVSNASREPCAA